MIESQKSTGHTQRTQHTGSTHVWCESMVRMPIFGTLVAHGREAKENAGGGRRKWRKDGGVVGLVKRAADTAILVVTMKEAQHRAGRRLHSQCDDQADAHPTP